MGAVTAVRRWWAGCMGKGMADWRAVLALALWHFWSLSGLLCFGQGSFRVRRVDRDFL
jgi:hypothetical protein